jgi:hypothetical protein
MVVAHDVSCALLLMGEEEGARSRERAARRRVRGEMVVGAWCG